MKKQIIIFLLFSLKMSAQNPHFPKVKINVPCTEEYADNYPGKWLVQEATLLNSPGKEYSLEALKRMDQIQKLVQPVYPSPLGADISWNATYITSYFGNKVKFVNHSLEYQSPNPVLVPGWRYHVSFHPWNCRGKDSLINIYPEADGSFLNIYANDLSKVAAGAMIEDDIMTIDGLPIVMKMPAVGNWKGYELLSAGGTAYADRSVIISRNGALPYKPVTRKQYLKRIIAYQTKFYDEAINSTADNPDKEDAARQKKNLQETKNTVISKYREAMEESSQKGLLESPAIVINVFGMDSQGPIFGIEGEGGQMLVTDNPDYLRKDLPKYVPQFFVITWYIGIRKSDENFRNAIEENFPIEKLQAMIDK